MTIFQPIFNHIKISKALLDNDINKLQNGRFFVVIIRMNVARAVSLLFYDDFMITQTLNQRNWK